MKLLFADINFGNCWSNFRRLIPSSTACLYVLTHKRPLRYVVSKRFTHFLLNICFQRWAWTLKSSSPSPDRVQANTKPF